MGIGSDPSSTSDLYATDSRTSSGKKSAFKQNAHPGQISNDSAFETPTSKTKTQWSEHVWSK